MNAALGAYRSLTRHKLFALLNIGGLALGIAVFLVLYLFVRFETGYDRVLPAWGRVWKVERTIQFPGNPELQIPSNPAMLGQLQAAFPALKGARMAQYDAATVLIGRSSTSEKLAMVDAGYFTTFPFPVVEGDIAATLARPDGVVITRRAADSYFGTASPLGRTLTIALDGKPSVYRVGAVIADMPKNMTYVSDLFIAMPAVPGEDTLSAGYGVTTFLTIPDRTTADRIADFIRHHPDPQLNPLSIKQLRTSIRPLPSLHLAEPRARMVIEVLGIVGIVALLLAMVNYVNLATARAGTRSREIALRKVVGASRHALIGQLLGETLVATTLAALVALALTEIALPSINAAGGTTLAVRYIGAASVLPPILLVIVVVTLVAGFYPAFVLSGFRPAPVLAAAQTLGGDRGGIRLRRILVVLQFGIATAMMIATAVLIAQSRHLQSTDLGFGRDDLVMVPGYADRAVDTVQRAALHTAMAALPGVTAVTTSAVAPGGGSFSIAPMHRPGARGEAPMIVQGLVGDNFDPVYRPHLLAGRWFAPARYALDDGFAPTGAPPRTTNIILNRTAVQRIGFSDPEEAVGKIVSVDKGSARIVGVIADMRFGIPQAPVEAFAYNYQSKDISHPVLSVRTAGDTFSVIAAMERAWHRLAPAVPFSAVPVDQKLYELYYRQDVQRSRLFTIGAGLAVVIACLGLYGLAAFDTARRTREIGIRKTLGASTPEILRLLVGQYLRPVILANLIAWPVAFFLMRRWLAGSDDRIALSPWYFLGASVAALAVAALTVLAHAWRAARAEPARALRHI